MNASLVRWRPHLAVATFGVLALLVVGAMLSWSWQAYRSALAQTGTLEPRYARLAGLVRAEKSLQSALNDARARLGALAISPAVAASKAGADQQQRGRELAEAAGLEVVASQIFPPRMDEGLERIGSSLTLEGTLAQVQAFLFAVGEQSPKMQIAALTLQPNTRRLRRSTAQSVLATVEIIQFRVVE
ncbi:MAG: hypothetical protein KDH20_03460 [Rhodocyclaceae bacterium]|nr:hypothetical protein [Rhodocyclaceae bacterium]